MRKLTRTERIVGTLAVLMLLLLAAIGMHGGDNRDAAFGFFLGGFLLWFIYDYGDL